MRCLYSCAQGGRLPLKMKFILKHVVVHVVAAGAASVLALRTVVLAWDSGKFIHVHSTIGSQISEVLTPVNHVCIKSVLHLLSRTPSLSCFAFRLTVTHV